MLLWLARMDLLVVYHAVSWWSILTLDKLFEHLAPLKGVLSIAVVKNASWAHIQAPRDA